MMTWLFLGSREAMSATVIDETSLSGFSKLGMFETVNEGWETTKLKSSGILSKNTSTIKSKHQKLTIVNISYLKCELHDSVRT